MRSTAGSRKRPEQRQVFLVDRTFGHVVVNTLRDLGEDLGFDVKTLADVYGSKRSEKVKDPRWIRRSANEGWIGITRDELRPWHDVIIEARARVFRIGRAAANAQTQATWIRANIHRT